MGSNPTQAVLFFSEKKELFRLVVLPCFFVFSLRRSKSFHAITQLGVVMSLAVNYPGPLLEIELESACLSS